MTKQVIGLYAESVFGHGESSTVFPEPPTWEQIKEFIGCTRPEHVAVLDHILTRDVDGRVYRKFVFTSMYVDEEFLLKDEPRIRNKVATEWYQKNIRAQFPDDPYPFRTAERLARERFEKQGFVYLAPDVPGHNRDDPAIYGNAVLFEGWTMDEVNDHFDRLEDE